MIFFPNLRTFISNFLKENPLGIYLGIYGIKLNEKEALLGGIKLGLADAVDRVLLGGRVGVGGGAGGSFLLLGRR